MRNAWTHRGKDQSHRERTREAVSSFLMVGSGKLTMYKHTQRRHLRSACPWMTTPINNWKIRISLVFPSTQILPIFFSAFAYSSHVQSQSHVQLTISTHRNDTPPQVLDPTAKILGFYIWRQSIIITFSKANLSSRKLVEGGWIYFFIWDTVLANKGKFLESHFYRNRFLFFTLWDYFPQQLSLGWQRADPQHPLSGLFLQVSGDGDCSVAQRGAKRWLRLPTIANTCVILYQNTWRFVFFLMISQDKPSEGAWIFATFTYAAEFYELNCILVNFLTKVIFRIQNILNLDLLEQGFFVFNYGFSELDFPQIWAWFTSITSPPLDIAPSFPAWYCCFPFRCFWLQHCELNSLIWVLRFQNRKQFWDNLEADSAVFHRIT